jgi:hypothetical protein
MPLRTPALLLALTLSACSPFDLGPSSPDGVTARGVPDGAAIANHTRATVYVFAGEEDDMARVDFTGEGFLEWPSIAPGTTRVLTRDEIAFFDEGDSRVWIYWRSLRDGGSLKVVI